MEQASDMEETIIIKSETPRVKKDTCNRSSNMSHSSMDSGYLTLTPHSTTCTPITQGCRTRASYALSKRHHHRIRPDPWQSERGNRHRSKLNNLLNTSENSENSLATTTLDSLSSSVEHHGSIAEHPSPDVVGTDYREFGMDLRSRTKRNWRTTVPITPAATKLHSPPTSPAVPSSSFMAFEPIEEDVEMKLVIVPQSTPHLRVSPRRLKSPILRVNGINVSPTTRKASPVITSADNQKLSKLCITDLAAIADIKPKRLDFSHRALSVVLQRSRAIPDYTGRERIDILCLLGEKSNHWRIVSRILALLAPQDLCSISMVSKAWRRICINDSRANTRRLSQIILRQNAKENLKLIKKAKMEAEVQNSPRTRYARKGYLMEVQNLLPPPQIFSPNSPPVSPSKVKFHSFVKASRTLAPWEHLLPCPRCSFACHVDGETNVGTCSRQGCSMEFCTSCSSKRHTGPCKTPLLATPTKRNKRLVVGSRQSKRNLRRL